MIRDIENLFGKVDEEDYYKPILVKSAFKSNYKIYESRGDKDKKLSVKQYLFKIIPYLSDMIKDRKATKLKNNKSREWRNLLNIRVNFISSKDTGETRTIHILKDNEEIRRGNETDDIIKERFEYF